MKNGNLYVSYTTTFCHIFVLDIRWKYDPAQAKETSVYNINVSEAYLGRSFVMDTQSMSFSSVSTAEYNLQIYF